MPPVAEKVREVSLDLKFGLGSAVTFTEAVPPPQTRE